MDVTRRHGRRALLLGAVFVLIVSAVGIGAANGDHGNGTANATHDDGGDIPWFPIITVGLLLLAIGIMGVRRVLGDKKDDGDEAD